MVRVLVLAFLHLISVITAVYTCYVFPKELNDPCRDKPCRFGANCVPSSDGRNATCACPKQCFSYGDHTTSRAICGSNDKDYPDHCHLRMDACNSNTNITVKYEGKCDLCRNVKCNFGAHCNSGKCVCPTDCQNSGNEPVCASTMITYPNECELQKTACQLSSDAPALNIVFYGDCREKFASNKVLTTVSSNMLYHPSKTALEIISLEQEACKDIHCDFDATCELGVDNYPRCTCKFDCLSTIKTNNKPVCASDLRIYPSLCIMKLESCQRQEELRLRPLDLCQGMKVKPCNGESPLKNSLTNKEIDCGNGPLRQDCPSGSYCHQTTRFAKCCMKANHNLVQKSCENSWYGCCPDGKSHAQGTDFEGCLYMCNCNKLGSISGTCDAHEQQCLCKPGVGGLKCDRCKPGYWGLPKISSGHQGCIPCGCSTFGSVREDCEQMTGRCVCKTGIQGQKCTICNNLNQVLGPNGCVRTDLILPAPTSCADLNCYFDGVCKEKDGFAVCECFSKCQESTEYQIVCGSDDQTYPSECHLRLKACQLQKDIVVQALGNCRDNKLFDRRWSRIQNTLLQYSKSKNLSPYLSKSVRNILFHDPQVTFNYKSHSMYHTERKKNI